MKYKLLRFSLLSMLVMLFGCWSQSASAADKWVKTNPSSLKSNDKVVIVDLTSSLAMSNNNGTSSAPSAVSVTLSKDQSEITGTVGNELTWYVEKDATTGGFKFAANLPASVGAAPAASYLYATNSNNGLRVGTNANNTFIMKVADANNKNDYLFNVATSRYIGVYSSQDWRSYATVNNNIKETLIAFFKMTADETDTRLATTIELANAPAEGIKGSSVSAPTATIRDASGAPVTQGGISWSSSNENVAYVSDATLYFVGAGTATITASFEGNTNYQPSSESFSVTVTAEPYTSFRALQADVSSTSVPISFTFSGQQVVFVNGKNAFLADGQGFGALVFTDGHGLVAGEKLTGTTSCNLELYQGNTEITNFDKSKLTTTTADVVPVETTLGNLSFANQSTLVTLKGLTYSDADKKLSDGTNNIIYYDKFKTNASLEDGKKYDVTGIVWIDGRASNPAPIIEICPRTAADVAEAIEESSASVTVLENIAALKAFTPSGDEPEDVVLTLTDAKVTLVDAEGDRIIFEDASAGYYLEGSGLSSQLKAGQTMNGTMSFTAEADYFGGSVLTLTDSNFSTTDGELTPLEVTEANADDYAENYDYRLAKFTSASIKVVPGQYSDDTFIVPDVMSGMEVGIMDLFGLVTEWPADGAKVEAIGWVINYMGMLTFFQPLSITVITDEPPADDREIIKWSERDVASAGQTAKSFSSPNQKITLEITDTDGKLAVDGNNCWFGDEEAQEKFTHRLKTGGKSSSKNALSMTVAEAGTLKIYVRTGSNSATDRNLVLTQDGVELFNQVIQESDAIKVKGMDSSDPEKETNVYPIISVPVAAGTVAITYPTNSLNFYAFEFVAGGEDTPEIPENAIWTSDEPTAIDWSGAINIAAEKFANAKIGDRILVEIVNPNDGGQVLPKSNWKDIEGSVPVNSSTTEVAFIITGDMMKFIKAGGLMIAGQNCSTKLVTLETTETTGSDESIWLGQANGSGNFPINYIHFVNANDGEGVKAGDILHITATEATGDKWLELFNSDWSSKLTADGFDITITEDFVDKLKVQYSSAYINFGGYNITQVELIPGTEEEPHLYVIGDMNGWDRVNMIELGYNNDADAFEYSITVDKTFYLAFSENQMTQKEAENDRDWSNFNASYRLAPQEGNFTPTLDEQVQLIHVDGSIVLNPGSYTFTITKDLKMTVTGAVSPVVNADYVVAGAPASVFGEEWNSISLDNRMTLQDDGTFAITYKAVQPQDNIQFKVVMWAEDADEAVWIGDDNGNNVTFNVTSECDVTITYDPATGKITVTGDGVAFATEFEYESVYVAGNGNGSWLNGENWTPNAEANKMTKVADDVWECTVDLSNIALDTNLEFKFAIDGNWTHDFGGSFIGFGQKTAAVYGGSNIVIPFKDIKNSTYKLRLDLSDFDLATKEGAKFTVSIVEDIVPVANLGTAYNMLELGEEPIFVDIALKNARVTMVQQVTYGEFLEKLEAVGLRYFDENGAKQGLYKAPKKDVEQDTPMDFAIIEDETGAMPFLACFLEDNGVSEGSVLNGDIVVILSNDFFPLALGDELEEHITDKMTATSLQALEVTDGTAGPTEITADNAEEYKANYGFRYVKFSESELTVGSSEEQRASTLKLDVIDETVDIGDFLGTGAILDEDGTVSVEGFMYEMFGAKLFQPTKMESGTNGINSVRFFENTKGTVYNLNGQRVTTPQKGVMIVNGKKVVVK